VCINKYGMNTANTRQVEEYCEQQGIRMPGKIPFDVAVVQAMVEQKTVMKYPCPEVQNAVQTIWQGLQDALAWKESIL